MSKTQAKLMQFIKPTTNKYKCEDLWRKIESSIYILFIIVKRKTVKLLAQWYVFKVYIDETNKKKAWKLE